MARDRDSFADGAAPLPANQAPGVHAGEGTEATNGTLSTVAEDQVIASASTEIKLVAGAIAELQSRLEHALNELDQVTAVRTSEIEIGRLFMEAQQFTESALAKLEAQVANLLAEASAKAQRIVAEAQAEANQLRADRSDTGQASAKDPTHDQGARDATMATDISVSPEAG